MKIVDVEFNIDAKDDTIAAARAAKSLEEAQKGIAFAAFLKLIIPIFVVLPGIIAYVINLDPETGKLIKVLPEGFMTADGKILNDNADVIYRVSYEG